MTIMPSVFLQCMSIFSTAASKFPDAWRLLIYGGEICEALKKYEEAFQYWDKAGEIGTYFYDELYCKASCYNHMGEYEKACAMYYEIAEKLRANHYDVEAEIAENEANRIKLILK